MKPETLVAEMHFLFFFVIFSDTSNGSGCSLNIVEVVSVSLSKLSPNWAKYSKQDLITILVLEGMPSGLVWHCASVFQGSHFCRRAGREFQSWMVLCRKGIPILDGFMPATHRNFDQLVSSFEHTNKSSVLTGGLPSPNFTLPVFFVIFGDTSGGRGCSLNIVEVVSVSKLFPNWAKYSKQDLITILVLEGMPSSLVSEITTWNLL